MKTPEDGSEGQIELKQNKKVRESERTDNLVAMWLEHLHYSGSNVCSANFSIFCTIIKPNIKSPTNIIHSGWVLFVSLQTNMSADGNAFQLWWQQTLSAFTWNPSWSLLLNSEHKCLAELSNTFHPHHLRVLLMCFCSSSKVSSSTVLLWKQET